MLDSAAANPTTHSRQKTAAVTWRSRTSRTSLLLLDCRRQSTAIQRPLHSGSFHADQRPSRRLSRWPHAIKKCQAVHLPPQQFSKSLIGKKNCAVNFITTLCRNILLFSRYSRRREAREYSNHPRLCVCVCDSVCLSVCPHDKTKTAETTITKLATEIVHHESSPTN